MKLTALQPATDLSSSDVLAGVQPGKGGRKFTLGDVATFIGAPTGGGGGSGYVDLDGGDAAGVTGSVTDLDGGNANG